MRKSQTDKLLKVKIQYEWIRCKTAVPPKEYKVMKENMELDGESYESRYILSAIKWYNRNFLSIISTSLPSEK